MVNTTMKIRKYLRVRNNMNETEVKDIIKTAIEQAVS